MSPSPTIGTMRVITETTGPSPDSDGYTVMLSGADQGPIAAAGERVIEDLDSGIYQVGLAGVAANCEVKEGNPRNVGVNGGAEALVEFLIACVTPPPIVGSLKVDVNTGGASIDPDGYTLTVDGAAHLIPVSASLTFENIVVGARVVTLAGLAGNCAAEGALERVLQVNEGATTTTAFAITCTPVPGSLRVTVTTSGRDLDPDGFTVTIGGGSAVAIPVNGTLVIEDVIAGPAVPISLGGAAANCGFLSLSTPEISIPSMGTGDLPVTARCVGPLAGRVLYTDVGTVEGVQTINALFSIAPDGTGAEQITIFPGVYEKASVAPDGSSIVVRGLVPGEGTRLMITNHLGAAPVFLPKGSLGFPSRPVWSPAGDRIVVESDNALWTMNVDGTDQVRITDPATRHGEPDWSPDGSRIIAAIAGGLAHMNADGSDYTVISLGESVGYPSWSPDGTKVVYRRHLDAPAGPTGIVVMDIDGSNRVTIDDYPGSTRPRWSPDGTRIVIERHPDIWVMDADGGNASRVIGGRHPTWGH